MLACLLKQSKNFAHSIENTTTPTQIATICMNKTEKTMQIATKTLGAQPRPEG